MSGGIRSIGPVRIHHGWLAVRVATLGAIAALLATSLDATRGAAQAPEQVARVGAEAVAAAVGAPPVPIDGGPYAALSPVGGNVVDAAGTTSIPGVGTLDLPSVTVSGGPTTSNGGTTTTTATIWNVDLFGGRVKAGDVRVTASATLTDGQAAVDGDVTFENLVVDGVPYPAVGPNTQIPLPGIGTLVVRERSIFQAGPGSATIWVRAFHVLAGGSGGPGIPAGGEASIASVTAGIPGVALTPPRVLSTNAVGAPGQYIAIATRAPIDTSIRESVVGNLNANFNGNFNDNSGNGNGNDNGGAGAPPVRTLTSEPVVVTVVIVIQTPTSAPATSAPTATPTP
ncbi:MAG: hypothetical protein IT305_12055 [Chloroflexi bacterium]|nr:hypothetical protein [Chloroflexota bacterium]